MSPGVRPPKTNPDGTIDFEAMDQHVQDLKAKYAQNAKNFETNTGEAHPSLGSTSKGDKGVMEEEMEEDSSAEGRGEVGEERGDADIDAPDGFADREQPHETPTQTQTQTEKGSSIVPDSHGSHV